MYVKIGFLAVKNWKELIIIITLTFGLIFILFFGIQQDQSPDYTGDGKGGKANVTALVLQYEPVIAEFAKQYGVSDYVELLMAQMQQESGGRGGDPMQSSESLGLPPNTLNDPVKSIQQGVKNFSELMKKAKGNVKIVIQSYNFGSGFIDYALKHGGYSKQVALAFSQMMAAKQHWTSYGDPNYVDHVLRYYTGGTYGDSIPVNESGFVRPVTINVVTSPFGVRSDPFSGVPTVHEGVDFSCNHQPIPVVAAKGGTVTREGWENPNNHSQGYGQRIYIDHGNGLVTVYGHLSKILVKPGQKVEQNQMIAKCGSTGSSTGMHVHFGTQVNGTFVDPMQFLGGK